MSIIVNLDVMLAKRKMSSQELAEKVVQETTQKSPNKFDLNKSLLS